MPSVQSRHIQADSSRNPPAVAEVSDMLLHSSLETKRCGSCVQHGMLDTLCIRPDPLGDFQILEAIPVGLCTAAHAALSLAFTLADSNLGEFQNLTLSSSASPGPMLLGVLTPADPP